MFFLCFLLFVGEEAFVSQEGTAFEPGLGLGFRAEGKGPCTHPPAVIKTALKS